MMIALRWLYEHAMRDDPTAWRPRDGGPAHCWHCGLACPNGPPARPTRKAIPDTYTAYDVVRATSSGWVCPACAAYFTPCLKAGASAPCRGER